MKTIAYAIALFAVICLPVKARSQQHTPLFKTAKELSEPYQKKQVPPKLLQLRQDIISGNKKITDLTLQDLISNVGNKTYPTVLPVSNTNTVNNKNNGDAG